MSTETSAPAAPPTPFDGDAMKDKKLQQLEKDTFGRDAKQEEDVSKARGGRRKRRNRKRKGSATAETAAPASPPASQPSSAPAPKSEKTKKEKESIDNAKPDLHMENLEAKSTVVKDLKKKIATVAKKVDVSSDEENESEVTEEEWSAPDNWEPEGIKPDAEVIRAEPESAAERFKNMKHSKRKGGGFGFLSCWCF